MLKNLDFETAEEHKLIVEASDSGRPRLTSTMRLTVNVHDVNDNAPVFEEETYHFRVSNHLLTNSQVGQVKATDQDTSQNGRITYTLGDAHPGFGIYPNSGVIYVKDSTSTTAGESRVTLKVLARDQGSPALESSVDVVIVLESRNDRPPRFERDQYLFRVKEDTKVGEEVGQVSLDGNFGAGLKYRMRTPTTSFALDEISGIVKN